MTKIFGKLRRFGYPVIKKLPKARTWPQLHELLQKQKSYLYNVRSVEVNFAKKGPGNAGTRFFVYFQLPALKFWNPDVTFKDVKLLGPTQGVPRITLEMANGTLVPIAITPEMKDKDILSKLLSVCGPTAFPQLPTPSELVKQLEEYRTRKASEAQSQSTQQDQQETEQKDQSQETQEELPHKQYEKQKPKRRVKEVKVEA